MGGGLVLFALVAWASARKRRILEQITCKCAAVQLPTSGGVRHSPLRPREMTAVGEPIANRHRSGCYRVVPHCTGVCRCKVARSCELTIQQVDTHSTHDTCTRFAFG